MYKHPGVYIEHVPSGLLSIEAASTSVAAFVGHVKRGVLVEADIESGKPVFISNSAQFAKHFGVLNDSTGGIRDEGKDPDYFGHAVNAFFANGGTKAYIVPIANSDGVKASGSITKPDEAAQAFVFKATAGGPSGNGIWASIEETSPAAGANPAKYQVKIGKNDSDGNPLPGTETYPNLVLDEANAEYLVTKINDAPSAFVKASKAPIDTDTVVFDISGAETTVTLSGGVGPKRAVGSIKVPQNDPQAFFFTALSAGKWANTLSVSVEETLPEGSDPVAEPAEYEVVLGVKNDKGEIEPIETFSGLELAADSPRSLVARINGQSELVSVEQNAADPGNSENFDDAKNFGVTDLEGGDDTLVPVVNQYSEAFLRLRDYRDVSIIILPGMTWKANSDEYGAAITHCEFMKNRMVIVDPDETTRLIAPTDVKEEGYPTSPYAALYYPWVEVTNPHYNAETAANKPKTFKIPPAGLAAGMWARIDAKRGVWKAPAGLEATVRGTKGPTLLIGNDVQDNLNEWGINCLRSIIGPSVIWGARTLATKTKPEFRYIPVRRTQNMIGESLYGALQAVVFEPNDHKLWATLRTSATNFMDQLHRAGAFQGEKASDAFYVRCGLDSTMTQADIDSGIVRLVVGFAPLKPAEFVVVQIQQIVGQTA